MIEFLDFPRRIYASMRDGKSFSNAAVTIADVELAYP